MEKHLYEFIYLYLNEIELVENSNLMKTTIHFVNYIMQDFMKKKQRKIKNSNNHDKIMVNVNESLSKNVNIQKNCGDLNNSFQKLSIKLNILTFNFLILFIMYKIIIFVLPI